MRSRLRGVYMKNYISIVLLVSLSLIILGAAFAGMSYSFIARERTEDMLASARSVGGMLRAYARDSDTGLEGINIRALLSWSSGLTGFHLIVTDAQGVVVNCSDQNPDCGHMGRTVPSGAVMSVNRSGSYTGHSDLGGVLASKRFVAAVALPAGPIQGCVFVSDYAGKTRGTWGSLAQIFIVAAIVVVILSFFIAYIVTRKLTRPIKEMSDAARSYTKGDFTPRVQDVGGDDEVSELAESFNAMADSLERSERSHRELIANVSHELKTPMTTIAGFADGLIDGTIPKEREEEYLKVISSETKRLSRLVRGMLDMSQLQSVTPMELMSRSFDLLEVVCQSLLSLEQKITSRDLDVETVLPEEPVFVTGDGDAIAQVVHNLLDNAAKFANPGTNITLKLWRSEGRAYVSVANRGETISKDELPLIFERFHKTDRSRSQDRDGVGLGLYIVKTILDSHDSHIYVSSRDGLTTFVFDLKLAKVKNTTE